MYVRNSTILGAYVFKFHSFAYAFLRIPQALVSIYPQTTDTISDHKRIQINWPLYSITIFIEIIYYSNQQYCCFYIFICKMHTYTQLVNVLLFVTFKVSVANNLLYLHYFKCDINSK